MFFGNGFVIKSIPVMLVGLITPFTLMAKLPQRSSQIAIVAQLVEHNLAKVRVAGSNPVYRSIDDERVIKRVSRGNTARIP